MEHSLFGDPTLCVLLIARGTRHRHAKQISHLLRSKQMGGLRHTVLWLTNDFESSSSVYSDLDMTARPRTWSIPSVRLCEWYSSMIPCDFPPWSGSFAMPLPTISSQGELPCLRLMTKGSLKPVNFPSCVGGHLITGSLTVSQSSRAVSAAENRDFSLCKLKTYQAQMHWTIFCLDYRRCHLTRTS